MLPAKVWASSTRLERASWHYVLYPTVLLGRARKKRRGKSAQQKGLRKGMHVCKNNMVIYNGNSWIYMFQSSIQHDASIYFIDTVDGSEIRPTY